MNSFAWLLRPIGRATLALCLPLLLAMAVPAAAQETPVPVLGIVNQGNACPTTSTLGAPTLPVFRQGDIVSICFGQNLAPSSSIQVKVGDKIAQVGQQSANGVLVGLPDQPNASTYVVSGTVNSTQFTPFLIPFYPTSKALVTGVSPATTIRGKPVRINGQGLAAPKSAIEVWFGDEKAQLDDVAADGSWVLATLAPNTAVTSGGPRPVEVRVWNLPADQPQGPVSATLLQAVGFNETLKIIGVALAPVVLVAAFVAWLFWSQQRRARNWLRG